MNRKIKFPAYFLCSYLLVLIPVLIVSVWSANLTMRKLQSNAHDSVLSRTQYAVEQMVDVFSDYAGGSAALSQEEALTSDFWNGNYKRYNAIQVIQRVSRYDPLAYSMFLHHPERGVYSSAGYSAEDPYLHATLKLLPQNIDGVRRVLAQEKSCTAALNTKEDGTDGYLLLHYPFFSQVRRSSFSVNYLIRYKDLGKQLHGLSTDGQLFVRLRFADASEICFVENDGKLSPSAALTPEFLQGYTAIETDIPLLQASLEVFYNPSELYAPVQQGQRTMLQIMAVGLLASTAISLLLSTRRMKNLQLLGIAAKGEAVEFHPESEYAFIGGLLRNLALESKSLAAQLEQHGDVIRQQTMQLILSGTVKTQAVANELLQGCGLNWSEEQFCIGSMLFLAPDDLWEKLPHLLRQELACTIEIGSARGLAFLGELPNQDEAKNLRLDLVSHFTSMLQQLGAQQIHTGISQVYQDPALIPIALREATECLPEHGAAFFETPPEGEQPPCSNQNLLSSFSEGLRSRSMKQTLGAFESIVTLIAAPSSSQSDKLFLRSCVQQELLFAYMEEVTAQPDILQTILSTNALDEAEYAAQIEKLIKNLCRETVKPNDFMMVVAYIQAHYADPDLSASDVAAFAGVNKAHLGRLFKTNTGKTYIEYLSDVRLKKACELLSQTSLPITEIARQVGYYDHSSFRRKFKSQINMDVVEYRNQYQDKPPVSPS